MAPTAFLPLDRPRKAYEAVADQIRGRILSGRLGLGDRLPAERDLAAQFGVSRVVLREAIRTLELAGFLTVRKGARGGVFVAQDYDRPIIESIGHRAAAGEVSLAHLFEVRRLVEPYAIARLTREGAKAELASLKALLDQADASKAAGENIRPYNIRFHRQLARLCGNPLLAVVGETAVTLITDRLAKVAGSQITRTHRDLHGQIFQALAAGNGKRATTLLLDDIDLLERSISGARPKAARSRPARP
ncbi:MAG: FadR family transcriptional regulator [Rhodospirillales bacterium]|nr:FadR family transcriptional regulator [Rhodospirillales bacterium]